MKETACFSSWVDFAKCNANVGEEKVNISIRNTNIFGDEDLEDKVCCLEKDIIVKFEVEQSEKICSDFEGFHCTSPLV